MGSATWTSGRTCMPTLSCPEAPPCTPVSLTGCRRRSPPWLPPPSRSRSSLLPRGSTPSGSVAPSWLLSPPSSPCGSRRRSTMSPAPPSSTGSASRVVCNSAICSAVEQKPVPNDKMNPAHRNKHLPTEKKKKKKKKTHTKKKTPPHKKKKKKKKKKN